jgi:hypothetical protein
VIRNEKLAPETVLNKTIRATRDDDNQFLLELRRRSAPRGCKVAGQARSPGGMAAAIVLLVTIGTGAALSAGCDPRRW